MRGTDLARHRFLRWVGTLFDPVLSVRGDHTGAAGCQSPQRARNEGSELMDESAIGENGLRASFPDKVGLSRMNASLFIAGNAPEERGPKMAGPWLLEGNRNSIRKLPPVLLINLTRAVTVVQCGRALRKLAEQVCSVR